MILSHNVESWNIIISWTWSFHKEQHPCWGAWVRENQENTGAEEAFWKAVAAIYWVDGGWDKGGRGHMPQPFFQPCGFGISCSMILSPKRHLVKMPHQLHQCHLLVCFPRLELFCHQIHIVYALSPLPSPTRYMKEGGKWQTCFI